MLQEVSREEFCDRAAAILRSVTDGAESVLIVDGGQPVATLAAYQLATGAATAQRALDKTELGFSPETGSVGSDSGREQVAALLSELGVPVADGSLLGEIYAATLELCDAKATVYTADLRALAQEMIAEAPQRVRLLAVTISSTTGLPTTAEVTLSLGHGPAMRREQGDGPLDAAIRAIERLTGLTPNVRNFNLAGATPGHDAMAEATIELELDGTVVVGAGASTNAVEAGIHAYVNALNFLAEARSQP